MRPGRIRRGKTTARRDLIVNLKNGTSIRGAVWRWTAGVIELKGSQRYQPGQSPVPVDGTALVLEADVDFIQDPKGD